jgi:hypothetical protein
MGRPPQCSFTANRGIHLTASPFVTESSVSTVLSQGPAPKVYFTHIALVRDSTLELVRLTLPVRGKTDRDAKGRSSVDERAFFIQSA